MKMKIVVFALLTLVLLSSCSVGGSAGPTQTPVNVAAIKTSVVQTVFAPLTQTAAAFTLTPTLTDEPTQTSTPEAVGSPTVTITPTEVICDDLQFLSDATVPDGQTMTAGQDFVKTWKVKNTGTCTWTTGYRLKFAYGVSMNGQTAFITTAVPPNTEAEISVTLKAPTQPGTYSGYWILANNNNTNFGTRLSVVITVP